MRAGLNNFRMRQLNKELVMSLIWREKVVTKSQIAKLTSLTIPAITNILDELISEGVISHSDFNLSSRGIGSGTYIIPETNPMTLCLNVTPNTIECQLADHQLYPIGDLSQRDIDAQTPNDLLEAIIQEYVKCKVDFPRRNIRIAIAIHGQVDPEAGVSQNMPQAPWKEHIEIKYLLEERLQCKVMVDNDCIMLSLAEKWLGNNQTKDFCVINVDYGIGSSFIINGSIYRGNLYGSGQIGHTIVNPDGVACSCGRYGCLETVGSLSAIKKQFRTWLKTNPEVQSAMIESLDTDKLIELWDRKDPTVQQIVESGANAVGMSIYNFLNILNINQIWLYGGCCGFGKPWLEIIKSHMMSNPFDHANSIKRDATKIEFGHLTRQQQIMGIAYLYVEDNLEKFRL